MGNTTSNFKDTPYWWEAAPPGTGTRQNPDQSYDVVVVGSGVTGLNAALTLAEGGKKVVVCDAKTIGFGASSRNNGAIVPYHFIHQEDLEKKFGQKKGAAIAKEAVDAVDFLMAMPGKYGFDPMIRAFDRYFLANTKKHEVHLAHDADLATKRGVGLGWQPVTNDEVIRRTGIRGFSGGLYIPGALAMHPGLFVQGVAKACERAGVDLVANCRVTRVRRVNKEFAVETQKGTITARNVVAATDGYSGAEFPQLERRLLTARLYQAATEPLAPELMAKFKDRLVCDAKFSMGWIRPTPDGTRMMVGGRGGMGGADAVKHAEILHADMVKFAPELASVKISHCWYGIIGFSHDFVPHIGEMDGIHYSAGYCGIGVAIGSYLGSRIGHKILGSDPSLSSSALDGVKFPVGPVPRALRGAYMRAGLTWIGLRDWWDLRSA